MTNKKKADEDKATAAEPTLPQPSKTLAHHPIDLILILSLAIEATTHSDEHAITIDKTGLLDLPLEIRVKIYDEVLAIDNDTYEIEGKSSSRWSRYTDFYRVTNINDHHLAILAVNRQTRAEVRALVPSKILRFMSIRAFDYFLLDREDDDEKLKALELELLHAAKKVQIVVGKRPHSRQVRRRWDEIRYILAELLPESPRIELVDDEGNDVGVKRVCILIGVHSRRMCTD